MKQQTISIKELPKLQAKAVRERWEHLLAQQIEDAGLPTPQPQYHIYMPGASHPCRADFAWPERKLLVEVQGGQWSHGAHTRGSGFEDDCRKYSQYALLGFRLMLITPDMISDGTAIEYLRKCLEET